MALTEYTAALAVVTAAGYPAGPLNHAQQFYRATRAGSRLHLDPRCGHPRSSPDFPEVYLPVADLSATELCRKCAVGRLPLDLQEYVSDVVLVTSGRDRDPESPASWSEIVDEYVALDRLQRLRGFGYLFPAGSAGAADAARLDDRDLRFAAAVAAAGNDITDPAAPRPWAPQRHPVSTPSEHTEDVWVQIDNCDLANSMWGPTQLYRANVLWGYRDTGNPRRELETLLRVQALRPMHLGSGGAKWLTQLPSAVAGAVNDSVRKAHPTVGWGIEPTELCEVITPVQPGDTGEVLAAANRLIMRLDAPTAVQMARAIHDRP